MLRVHDHKFAKDRVVLNPGEYWATDEDVIVYTVLGSCVSVCLRDPISGLAGMNHFLLPSPFDTSDPGDLNTGKFGTVAMAMLIEQMQRMGSDPRRLVAKVFGGGHVLGGTHSDDRIPESNIRFATTFLAERSIPIAAQDTGGDQGRKVLLVAKTGNVLVRRLARTSCNATTAVRTPPLAPPRPSTPRLPPIVVPHRSGVCPRISVPTLKLPDKAVR